MRDPAQIFARGFFGRLFAETADESGKTARKREPSHGQRHRLNRSR